MRLLNVSMTVCVTLAAKDLRPPSDSLRLGTSDTYVSYRDDVFSKIRDLYDVKDDFDTDNFWKVDKKGKGGGKSKSSFIPSRCGKFCLKSAPSDDKNGIVKLVDSYYAHISSSEEKESFVPSHFSIPILKVYKLDGTDSGEWYILMPYIKLPEKCVNTKFDFKGSLSGRTLGLEHWPELGQKKEYKDKDFFGIFKSIMVDPQHRAKMLRLRNRIRCTVDYLNHHQMVDYSLILQIEFGHTEREEAGHTSIFARADLGSHIQEDITIHFMTILDYLIPGTSNKKKFEAWLKSFCKNEASVTCPKRYSSRMLAALGIAFGGGFIRDTPKDRGQTSEKFTDYYQLPAKCDESTKLTLLLKEFETANQENLGKIYTKMLMEERNTHVNPVGHVQHFPAGAYWQSLMIQQAGQLKDKAQFKPPQNPAPYANQKDPEMEKYTRLRGVTFGGTPDFPQCQSAKMQSVAVQDKLSTNPAKMTSSEEYFIQKARDRRRGPATRPDPAEFGGPGKR